MIGNLIFFNFIFLFFIPVILFWFLSKLFFFNSFFFEANKKYIIFECGFKTLNLNTLKISFNSIIIVIFLFLYEFEVILLLPFFINFSVNLFSLTNILLIILFIFLTLILDYIAKILQWAFLC